MEPETAQTGQGKVTQRRSEAIDASDLRKRNLFPLPNLGSETGEWRDCVDVYPSTKGPLCIGCRPLPLPRFKKFLLAQPIDPCEDIRDSAVQKLPLLRQSHAPIFLIEGLVQSTEFVPTIAFCGSMDRQSLLLHPFPPQQQAEPTELI